ncbi:MAG: hypothetical protein WC262_09685 [Bacteroidales bacterium]
MRKSPARETFLLGSVESNILASAIETGIACSKSDAARKALLYWGEHHDIIPQKASPTRPALPPHRRRENNGGMGVAGRGESSTDSPIRLPLTV